MIPKHINHISEITIEEYYNHVKNTEHTKNFIKCKEHLKHAKLHLKKYYCEAHTYFMNTNSHYVEFLKSYIMTNNIVSPMVYYKVPFNEFMKMQKTIEFPRYSNTNTCFHHVLVKYIYNVIENKIGMEHRKNTIMNYYFTDCSENDVRMMEIDQKLCHLYWCSYPPYVEFLKQSSENIRALMVFIHDFINQHYENNLCNRVFADSYIVFNLIKFL